MQKILILLLLIGSHSLHAQTADRYWWHDDGEKAEWFSQPDVYVFSTVDDVGILAPQNLPGVQSIAKEPEWNGLHVMRFYQNATATEKQAAIDLVKNNPDYDCDLDVITPYPALLNGEDKWRVTDDLVQVLFEDPGITNTQINDFMGRWNLTLAHEPFAGLDPSVTWTYLFRNNHPNRCQGRKAIDIAREIMIEDSAMVRYAEPNILRLFEPHTNDSLFANSWHIENTGQLIVNEPGATADADSDIKEAWAKGFLGNNVDVVVMDYAFDWNHEDMVGAYQFWDNRADTFPIPTYPLGRLGGNNHGEAVAGAIGARKDNLYGAVGVAPECNLGAFMFEYSPAQAIQQFQLIASNPDGRIIEIVNMSWGTYDTTINGFQAMHNAIQYLATFGRDGKGTVLIASAGNRGNADQLYPAAFPEVISITSTTPNDLVKVGGDYWQVLQPFSDWGANIGPTIDFAAPGLKIQTTDLTGQYGRSQGNYYLIDKTSAASAVAAGIAALIMEEDSLIPASGPYSVYEILKQGAEKVGGYNYAYNPSLPGKSFETGYGRLNACNSANLVHLHQEQSAFAAAFRVAYLTTGEIRAYYDLRELRGNFQLELLDLHGRILANYSIQKGSSWQSLPTQDLANGIYLLRISSADQVYSDTEKVVVCH